MLYIFAPRLSTCLIHSVSNRNPLVLYTVIFLPDTSDVIKNMQLRLSPKSKDFILDLWFQGIRFLERKVGYDEVFGHGV